MRLRALHEALAVQPARADGNHGLQDVKALAQRVTHGVQQRAHALALVFAQHVPVHPVGAKLIAKKHDARHARQRQRHRRQHPAPGQPGEKNHGQAAGHDQQRRAQIRLLHDERHRHGQQRKSARKVHRLAAPLPLPPLKPAGQHERHGNLHDLAGLNHHAHIQPALRAFFGDAKQRHRHQQQHARRVNRHGQPHQPLRRRLRHHEHDGRRQQHVAPVHDKARAVVKAGGIHDGQPQPRQQQHGGQQRPVKPPEHGQHALPPGRRVKSSGLHG